MTPIRILMADDHEVIRRGLRALLEAHDGWEVSAEAAHGREAVEKALKTKPHVVILDLSMPELNGLEAARQILKALPETEVLILTLHESEQWVRDVLEAGAHGYLLKSDAARDLVTAVESLSQRRPFFTSKVGRKVLDGYLKAGRAKSGPQESASGTLTVRERHIAQLLAEGKSSKEVAATLGVSTKTVETHRANLMHKLGCHSLADLVHYAVRNRIIDG